MTFQEIKEELNSVLKGKTLDSILPPIIFVLFYQLFSLTTALIIGIIFALSLTSYRLYRKNAILYSLLGLLGIILAMLFAQLMGNINDYFLPGIIGSVLLVLITFLSLLFKRPLPLLLSHLTRGWTFKWFLRDDVYPAYFEAGLFWLLYFFIRAALQVYFYVVGSLNALTLLSTVFGFPLTTLILIATYIYGIKRLKSLNGPGIEEYDQGVHPPYKGQTRGF